LTERVLPGKPLLVDTERIRLPTVRSPGGKGETALHYPRIIISAPEHNRETLHLDSQINLDAHAAAIESHLAIPALIQERGGDYFEYVTALVGSP